MNKNIPSDFVSKNYIELNNDLRNMTELEAKIHYENTGCKENRKYKYVNIPNDFKATEYIELNDDLKDLSELQAKLHYENEGYNENKKYKYSQIDLNYNVYVYCSGKSGSSTLTKTFIKNGYNTLHVHNSLDFKIHNIESKLNPNLFELIENSMKNNNNVYIIDVYRNPIERKISSFFQNYNINNNNNIDYITNEIDNFIYNGENYYSMHEIFNYFKLQNFDFFDFKNQYNILQYKNVTFIKLRFEDINYWGDILTKIFKKPITIYNDNLSENKKYNNELNIIKKTYQIPEYMIQIIKNNKEFKIYNTTESQEKYLDYWSKRTKIFKYENIPINFNPKDYIELNEDLTNLTELQAKLHYEYEGYKENRKYKYKNIPIDFIAKDYIELNEDLINLTELQAKLHYEYEGYKENRKYSE
jgi:hypothetical protein